MKCIENKLTTNSYIKMKKQAFLFIMVWFATISFAQTHDLTPEELDAFKVQCQERIDAFQLGIEIIADKKQDESVKQHYINTLPDMFMGAGDPWSDVTGQRHPAVKMQIAVIRYNQTIDTRDVPLKTYLANLRNLKWTSVKITKAKTCMISNFYKINENRYEATATFFQYFEGESGEKHIYKDFTQKEVKVYISKVEDGQLGTYWDLKFGDINVSEIKKM